MSATNEDELRPTDPEYLAEWFDSVVPDDNDDREGPTIDDLEDLANAQHDGITLKSHLRHGFHYERNHNTEKKRRALLAINDGMVARYRRSSDPHVILRSLIQPLTFMVTRLTTLGAIAQVAVNVSHGNTKMGRSARRVIIHIHGLTAEVDILREDIVEDVAAEAQRRYEASV
jgi:hypothetical protein